MSDTADKLKRFLKTLIPITGIYVLVMYAAYLASYLYAVDLYEQTEPQWVDALEILGRMLQYPAILFFGNRVTPWLPVCNAVIWSLATYAVLVGIRRRFFNKGDGRD